MHAIRYDEILGDREYTRKHLEGTGTKVFYA
jgi:hypothetical protein